MPRPSLARDRAPAKEKKPHYYCFSPKALVLVAASTNLDIRLVRNEWDLISFHKFNSFRRNI
jgi:hypothetical protein